MWVNNKLFYLFIFYWGASQLSYFIHAAMWSYQLQQMPGTLYMLIIIYDVTYPPSGEMGTWQMDSIAA